MATSRVLNMPASCRLRSKVAKIGRQLEPRGHILNALPNLADVGLHDCGRLVARGQEQITDAERIDAHDAAASGVHGHRIAPRHQHPGGLRRALNGAVAFHPDDAIHQCELARKGPMRSAMHSEIPAQCSTFLGQP